MISQRSIFLILTTLTAWEFCQAAPHISLGLSLALVFFLVLFGLSLTFACAVMAMRSGAGTRQYAFWVRCRGLWDSCWCMSYAAMLLLVGWMAWMRAWHTDFLPGSLSTLMLLLPHATFVICGEVVWTLVGLSGTSDVGRAWSQCFSKLRLGEFGTLVLGFAPAFLVNVVHDLWLTFSWGGISTPLFLLLLLPLFYVCLLLFPPLLSLWMSAGRVSQPDCTQRVEELMRGVGISHLDLREVRSQGQWAGAAVVGWLPATRQLWLGDGLLEKLSSQELDMVLLHELAHIQRGHHWRRVFPVGVALVFGVCGFASCGFWLPDVSAWLAPIVAMLICLCTLVVGLGVTSRECELEADRVACRTAAANCEWSGGHQQRAALMLGSALIKLTGPGNRSFRQRNWLHPSLRERLSGLALELSKQRE